jgi:hypothetical protein
MTLQSENQLVWSTWPRIIQAMFKMEQYDKARDPISLYQWESVIGLKPIDVESKPNANGWFFEIVDKEKFLFAIMKYGIDEEFFYHNR